MAEELFRKAVDLVKLVGSESLVGVVPKLSETEMLEFYALYEGDRILINQP